MTTRRTANPKGDFKACTFMASGDPMHKLVTTTERSGITGLILLDKLAANLVR
jgi:hypothetical protein